MKITTLCKIIFENYSKKFSNYMQIKLWQFYFERKLFFINMKRCLENLMWKCFYLILIIIFMSLIGFSAFYFCKIFHSWTLIPFLNQILWAPFIGLTTIFGIIISAILSILIPFSLLISISKRLE